MINWKSDKRVHLAIGIAIAFVGAKWLFTGNLFYAVADVMQKPAEGQTKVGLTFTALLPIVFDVVIGGLIAVGAYSVNLAELLFGRARQLIDKNQVATSPPDPSPHVAAVVGVDPSLDSPIAMKRAVDALGDAAAENDREQIEKLLKQIRKPYALAALTEAYGKGDTEAAAALVSELNGMLDKPVVSKKKGAVTSDA